MVDRSKESMMQIDRAMMLRWVKDLVVVKTFIGLRFQEAVLKKIADKEQRSYRLAGADEEAKGIDGYIGDTPVSIKPESYRIKSELTESFEVRIIFY